MPERQPTLHRDYRGTRRTGSTSTPKPNRLTVLPDPAPGKPRQYAIVTTQPLHSHHGLRGYQRGFGERHGGLWAYSFVHWFTAARVAHDIAGSSRAVFEGGE